jgi:hypothetical protein
MEEDLDPAADSLSLDDSTFQYHHAQSPVQPQQPCKLNNSSSSTERSQSWLDSDSVGSSEAEGEDRHSDTEPSVSVPGLQHYQFLLYI